MKIWSGDFSCLWLLHESSPAWTLRRPQADSCIILQRQAGWWWHAGRKAKSEVWGVYSEFTVGRHLAQGAGPSLSVVTKLEARPKPGLKSVDSGPLPHVEKCWKNSLWKMLCLINSKWFMLSVDELSGSKPWKNMVEDSQVTFSRKSIHSIYVSVTYRSHTKTHWPTLCVSPSRPWFVNPWCPKWPQSNFES